MKENREWEFSVVKEGLGIFGYYNQMSAEYIVSE